MADIEVDPFNPADSSTYPDPKHGDILCLKDGDDKYAGKVITEDLPKNVDKVRDDPPLPDRVEVGACWITQTREDVIVWVIVSPEHGPLTLTVEGRVGDKYAFDLTEYVTIGYKSADTL